jgi:oxygen-dependent protoporphyrinogen oxidase
MISGIYGGDAKQLIFKEAFPKIYAMEQERGSVVVGMMNSKKKTLDEDSNKYTSRMLFSFFNGMSELTNALAAKYTDGIELNQTVSNIVTYKNGYAVSCSQKQYTADEVFICTPAHQAGQLLRNVRLDLTTKK